MPAVHKQIARKDYPAEGIKVGDTYYSWQLYRQAPQRSLKPPRPSQLTTGKRSEALAATEELHEAVESASGPEDIVLALDECAEAIRGTAEEYRESASNMEDAFPNGSSMIDELNEKADALDEYANACDDAKATIEAMSAADFGEGNAAEDLAFEDAEPSLQQEWLDGAKDEVHSLDLEI